MGNCGLLGLSENAEMCGFRLMVGDRVDVCSKEGKRELGGDPSR
jgi:hypothetical protein